MTKLHTSPKAAVQTEDAIQQDLNRKALRKQRITTVLPFASVAALVIFFTISTGGRFISLDNLKLLLNQCFTMEIVVVGGAFLYAIGGLDMSIGAVMALSAMVITLLLNAGVSLVWSFLAGVVVAVAGMSITACAKNYLHITPFIASMSIMNVCNGLVLTVTAKNGIITFPFSQVSWLNGTGFKIIVLLVTIAIGYFLFNYTSFGKSLRAIGGNAKVAKISGIHVERSVLLAYVVIGITLAIGGLFTVVRAGSADTSVGSGLNLNIMTAIVLGGFPLSGGANAKFSAPLVGALLVSILTNGLGLMGYANAVGYAVKGILFIIVIAMTYEKSKGKLIN